MKTIRTTIILAVLILFQNGIQAQELRNKIVTSIAPIETTFSSIQKERKVLLDQLASRIYKKNRSNGNAGIVFIDGNNKTKSQLAAIWLKTGLIKYKLYGYDIQSAGLEVVSEPFPELETLKPYGFKVRNASGNKPYSYNVKFGSDSWQVYYKDLNSLENSEESLKVFVEDTIAMEDDPMQISVPLYAPETIAREMLYVASRIEDLTQSQQ
jgi:hypothetical protein